MCEVANYTEVEYNRHLTDSGWSRPETDHLMDLAQRFDLRFIVMADRWDTNTYTKERTVEDLKERCEIEEYFWDGLSCNTCLQVLQHC